MREQELLADCLRRLNRIEIQYYVTGSMASNFWGLPRTTHDLDFVVQLPPSAVDKIVSAFSPPDFSIDKLSVLAAYKPPHQFNAIDSRSNLKVDFWLPRPTPFEAEMLRRKLRVALLGEPAWIATPEDSILHKLVWNKITPSDRQMGDAAGVYEVQGGKLDTAYLTQWAEILGVTQELNRIVSGEIKPKRT